MRDEVHCLTKARYIGARIDDLERWAKIVDVELETELVYSQEGVPFYIISDDMHGKVINRALQAIEGARYIG